MKHVYFDQELDLMMLVLFQQRSGEAVNIRL